MKKPAFRKLRGYAFDPTLSATLGLRNSNNIIFKIRWEENLAPGPVGEYFEVVDYDPTQQYFYNPVDLNSEEAMADYGLEPDESDPKFHQQFVYAVAMNVLAIYEKNIGRKITWSRQPDLSRPQDKEYVCRLRIYPHAMRQQNAYYSPDKVALLFGYFKAGDTFNGRNIPNSAVYTCLSPDIIAHELSHAVLDTMHPHLRFNDNKDSLAFHEGYSDIIALLQRFTFEEVVVAQIISAKGDLNSPVAMFGDLAMQFGQATSSARRALRSFLVTTDENGKVIPVSASPEQYSIVTEPHERGGLLVAAVFDALVRQYKYNTADLLRINSDGTGVLKEGDISQDLARRLAREACSVATKLLGICIKALDYCPPVDLTFGDFLRALVTADIEHNTREEESLRFALMEAFRERGLVPSDLFTFSEKSLQWKRLSEFYTDDNKDLTNLSEIFRRIFLDVDYENEVELNTKWVCQRPQKDLTGSQMLAFNTYEKKINSFKAQPNDKNLDSKKRWHKHFFIVRNRIEQVLRERDREKIFYFRKEIVEHIGIMLEYMLKDNDQWDVETAPLLGLYLKEAKIEGEWKYGDANFNYRLQHKSSPEFRIQRCVPFVHYNADTGEYDKRLLISIIQEMDLFLDSDGMDVLSDSPIGTFWGGATLIFDLADFSVRYAIVKNIHSNNTDRLYNFLAHTMNSNSGSDNAALLMQDDKEPFAALHLH